MSKCLHCGRELGPNDTTYDVPDGPLCLHCGDAKFDVWAVCLAGEKTALASLACLTEDDKDNGGFHVIRSKISGVKYYSLPEFAGF